MALDCNPDKYFARNECMLCEGKLAVAIKMRVELLPEVRLCYACYKDGLSRQYGFLELRPVISAKLGQRMKADESNTETCFRCKEEKPIKYMNIRTFINVDTFRPLKSILRDEIPEYTRLIKNMPYHFEGWECSDCIR